MGANKPITTKHMFTLPTPLHPVIVHFPIVFILIGAAAAGISVLLNRWHLPWFAAVLLSLGSLGAFVASETGETAEDAAGTLLAPAEALVESHEEWAERTQAVSAAAAVLAVASALLGAYALRRQDGDNLSAANDSLQTPPHTARLPLFALTLTLRAVTAFAGLGACYCVYQTGHAGGKLVYEHGVGVKNAAAVAGAPSGATRARSERD